MQQSFKETVSNVIEVAEDGVKQVERTIDTAAQPVRRSLIKRFPIIFTLLVTFGVAATFLGLEQIAMELPFIFERPWLMLSVGVATLVLTGTLYKKL